MGLLKHYLKSFEVPLGLELELIVPDVVAREGR
jgi:hypothetical protein